MLFLPPFSAPSLTKPRNLLPGVGVSLNQPYLLMPLPFGEPSDALTAVVGVLLEGPNTSSASLERPNHRGKSRGTPKSAEGAKEEGAPACLSRLSLQRKTISRMVSRSATLIARAASE